DLGLGRAALWGLLATLASKSLTAPDPRTPGRYRILESLRAYGLEQLGAEHELVTVHDLLLRRYADLAEQMYGTFAGRAALLAESAAEADNIHYAMGIAEAAADPRYPRIANLLSAIWHRRGELPRARALLTHLVNTTALSPVDRMETLRRIAVDVAAGGDGPLAIRYAEECRALARSVGDNVRLAEALNALANAHVLMGDFAASIALIREHLPLIRSIPNPDHLCLTLGNLAGYLLATGQADAAQDAIGEALALADTNVITFASAAVVSLCRDEFDAATAHAQRALTLARPGHHVLVDCCEVLAMAAAERGDPIRALRLFAATASIRIRDGLQGAPWWGARVGRAASAASASVPPEAARAATAEGATLAVEDTIAYALHDTLPDRAAAPDSPLTEREQDVAELVAHGYTNAQIAARLFISNRTVATHLTHIRAKLGLPSRVHIAAWINNQKPAASG
ncbi:MAG: hypothetical protein QOJ50_2811, partial [Cryptosporangiaceae bacterium]|nr:hypothetical protein [Cryptosporangiaceae bacterium]